ncbi:protein NinF [Siccibacter colletis]|uniref:protein NinF n=1 Tax=Siccibacter colletis TaxID=1505757 RepID=UPI003CEEC40E
MCITHDRRCADCQQPLTAAEVWVCEQCCSDYVIHRDPNGFMSGDDPPPQSDKPNTKSSHTGAFFMGRARR